MVIIRDWCLEVCIHDTRYCACSDFIIIIISSNSICLPLCPWIAAVKHHVNDKDEMWRAAERNWLWITRTQGLLQWCYQSLRVRLCPDTGLSSLTLLINVGMQQLSPSSFNPGNKMSHHWPHVHWMARGAGCHCICYRGALPISSKHVSCQGASGLYLGWQERREIGEKAYLRLSSQQLLPSFTSVAERISVLPCWLFKGNRKWMNECLPGFTARLEPLCYTVCLANLEGTRIGIVKRIMYAVFPPASHWEALCCVNLPVAAVH